MDLGEANELTSEEKLHHHYFVDEAGDLTLFNKRGTVIVGQEGSSKVFRVGVAHIPDPRQVHEALERLRSALLADPYFQGVPSMSPEGKKTSICFHAKDDLPEVRREVFKLFPQFGAKVRVAIRRKAELAAEAQTLFKSGQKLRADAVYDDLVKALFQSLLHEADENHIVFARRGKSERMDALKDAIAAAKVRFESGGGGRFDRPTDLLSAYPSEHAGLQVVDYYLWGLQRLYERGEERFFRLLAVDYQLVMDLDDVRNDVNGEIYDEKNPISIQKIKPLTG